MFATVATHTPRNSRRTAGTASGDGDDEGAGMQAASAARQTREIGMRIGCPDSVDERVAVGSQPARTVRASKRILKSHAEKQRQRRSSLLPLLLCVRPAFQDR